MESSAPWRTIESEPAGQPGTGDGSDPGGDAGMSRRVVVAGLVVAAVLAMAAFALAATRTTPAIDVATHGSGEASDPASSASLDAVAPDGVLVVEVVGAVAHPGLYRLPAAARVADAIALAGGFGPRVDSAASARTLNLAALVTDGEQIRVPSRDDAPSPAGSSNPGSGTGGSGPGGGGRGGPVDLNHASADELDALPGIGPVTAAKIIAAREQQPFRSVDDLGTRKIVGPATLAKLRPLVVVR